MLMRQTFPNWKNLSNLAQPYWWLPFNSTGWDKFQLLHYMIRKDQEFAYNKSSQTLYELSQVIASELISLQTSNQSSADTLHFQYLQFQSTLIPLHVAMDNGEMQKVHDWILNGFSEDISEEIIREFHSDRICDFLASDLPWIKRTCISELSYWLPPFYSYCRLRSALPNVAEILIPATCHVLDCLPEDSDESLEVQRYLLDWSASHDHKIAPSVAKNLEYRFEHGKLSPFQRARIAIQMSTDAGRFSNRPQRKWAEWALSNTPNELQRFEPFQLLLTTIETKAEWTQKKEKILTAMDKAISSIVSGQISSTGRLLLKDQRADLFNPLVFKLHQFNMPEDLLDALCTWHQVPKETRRRDNILFVLPNHSEGMAYLGQSPLIMKENNWDLHIVRLNESFNNALGTYQTLQGHQLEASQLNRKGQPNYEVGQSFEETLNEFYKLGNVPKEEIEKSGAMVSFPGYSIPLQAMILDEFEKSLPITSSLQTPRADRSISNVEIWYSANDFYSKMEAEAVSGIFSASGINAQMISGEEASKADFLRFYKNPKTDLLWLAGHGIHNRWDPHSPAIDLGAPGTIAIDELLSINLEHAARRLFVLNICDGGVSSSLGSIQKLGMGPALSSSNQATISHLWPVEPRVASAFGLMLAGHLSAPPNSYFTAFEKALHNMKSPWEDIVAKCAPLSDGELVDRLQSTTHDTANIFHWGSPCFFE